MTLRLNQFRKNSAQLADCSGWRSTRAVTVSVMMAAGALACSGTTPTNMSVGGGGGQASGGAAGTGIVGGTSTTPTGGTPTSMSGTGGMPAASGSATTGGGGTGTVGGGGSSTGGSSGGSAGGSGGSGGGSGGSGGGGGGADGFVPLFNGKDLTGWTPGPSGAPLFAVDSAAGEPAIHVYPDATAQKDGSTQNQSTLRTNDSYSSYVLHVEYKWGARRFSDRAGKARDNGICWHVQLPLPTSTEWPTSI